MQFVYPLRSVKDDGFSIGQTNDLERRLAQHNDGLVDSKSIRGPLEIVYYEAYPAKQLADVGSAYTALLNRLELH